MTDNELKQFVKDQMKELKQNTPPYEKIMKRKKPSTKRVKNWWIGGLFLLFIGLSVWGYQQYTKTKVPVVVADNSQESKAPFDLKQSTFPIKRSLFENIENWSSPTDFLIP